MKLSNLGFFVVRKWVTIMHLPLDYKFLKKILHPVGVYRQRLIVNAERVIKITRFPFPRVDILCDVTELVVRKITYSRWMEQMPLFTGKRRLFYEKLWLWGLCLYSTVHSPTPSYLLRTEDAIPASAIKHCAALRRDG
jgi:hypothetical protein